MQRCAEVEGHSRSKLRGKHPLAFVPHLATYCIAHQVPQVWREEQHMLSEQVDVDFSVPFT